MLGAELCSASVCVRDENRPPLTQGCAVWVEKHQTWVEGALHPRPPATPPPTLPFSFKQTRAGSPLLPGRADGVRGWGQSRCAPEEEEEEPYLGFLTSVILVCSPNSRFRNSSRGPDS